MKKYSFFKLFSIVCSIIGIVLSLKGLFLGLASIGAPGLGGIGVIFLLPAIILLIVILFDLLITLGIIKKGLIYSCINSFIKTCIVLYLIKVLINEYQYEIKYGFSNFQFYFNVFFLFILIAIPSILNSIKLFKQKKDLLK